MEFGAAPKPAVFREPAPRGQGGLARVSSLLPEGAYCPDSAGSPRWPVLEAHLYASILTRKRDRTIKPSDTTDIRALSAYAPYMDVVCTDAFMADQMLGIAKEYGIQLFHGTTTNLRG